MDEFLVAFIFISGIAMSGFRRAKLLNIGYSIQSFLIAIVYLEMGYRFNEYHYYLLFILTILIKVLVVPIIINRSIKGLRESRETKLIITGFWSYILSGVSVVLTFLLLNSYDNSLLKAGIVLVIVGCILIIGRKKAITQMIGFLTFENGIVLLEISMVKMGFIIDLGIIFEMLVLVLIMGMMIFRINKTFDTIDTDYLANLKE